MADYAVVINFAFPNEEAQSIVLDTINDVSVDDTSTLTEHPIVSGDMVIDHMIRNPVSMTITGSLSTSSSPNPSALLIKNNKVDLTVSQEIFTRIKNEGILCEIYKISVKDKDVKFKRRDNMALRSISWVERINSLDFTFSFEQVMLADIQTYYVDMDDQFLPNVNFPEVRTFTDTLIDWEEIDKIVARVGEDTGLITHDFLIGLSGMTTAGLIALGVGIAVAKVLVSLTVVSGGVGLLIGVGILIAGAIAGLITGVINSHKYRVNQFKYYKDSRKFDQEVERYADFTDNIHKQLQQLDTQMQVYALAENIEQECMLSIGDEYYTFSFKKNNVADSWSLDVTNIRDDIEYSVPSLDGALINFGQCADDNYILKTSNNSYVYIMNPSEDTNDLKNFFILVTTIKPSEFNNKVTQIVKEAVLL